MIRARPAGKLLVAGFYTLYMCRRIVQASALGDARGRAEVRAWAAGLRGRLGIEVRARGMERVDWSRPYVIMANHSSYLDVLALYSALPDIVGFIAKKELYRVPVFSGVLRAVGCVPVDRRRHEEAVSALAEAARRVRGGASIAIFPEGTRSPGDRILPLKKGPFHLLQMAGVDILPVGIRGAGALMPRENTGIRSGVIEVHAGAPLPPPPPGDDAARATLAERVREELSRLAALPRLSA